MGYMLPPGYKKKKKKTLSAVPVISGEKGKAYNISFNLEGMSQHDSTLGPKNLTDVESI